MFQKFSHFLRILVAWELCISPCTATIVVSVAGAELRDGTGNPIIPGTLLQFVKLGADGIFNPINLADGTTGELSQWVSGDDELLSVSYTLARSDTSDFSHAGAFDLSLGNDTAGMLDRVFQFADGAIPPGTKLGLRWFPGLTATSFANVTLEVGQQYGEFTRQTNSQNGGVLWQAPSSGANVSFDSLFTESMGGTDPNFAGTAHLFVIPEPSPMWVLGLYGLGLFGYTRMRSRHHV